MSSQVKSWPILCVLCISLIKKLKLKICFLSSFDRRLLKSCIYTASWRTSVFSLNILSNFKIFFISFVAAMAYVEAKQ